MSKHGVCCGQALLGLLAPSGGDGSALFCCLLEARAISLTCGCNTLAFLWFENSSQGLRFLAFCSSST